MLEQLLHSWERRVASATTDRVVRPFEWGLDWIPANGHPGAAPAEVLGDWVASVMADTDAFYTPQPITDYVLDGDCLAFPSAFSPHPENHTVHCRHFHARREPRAPRAAVLVLPQWNADATNFVLTSISTTH
jgi:hypothetical protein